LYSELITAPSPSVSISLSLTAQRHGERPINDIDGKKGREENAADVPQLISSKAQRYCRFDNDIVNDFAAPMDSDSAAR
jgi:hypothetical protein